MKWFKVSALALFLLVVSGCASQYVRMESVGPDGRLGHAARYTLAAEGRQEGMIVVDADGRVDTELDGRNTDTVNLRIVVDNSSDSSISVPADSIRVVDDQGRELVRARLCLPPAQSPPVFVVPPHCRTSFEALYDVGAPCALRTTGSVTATWEYHFRGQVTRHQTRFLPIRYIERVDYVTVGFGVGYCW